MPGLSTTRINTFHTPELSATQVGKPFNNLTTIPGLSSCIFILVLQLILFKMSSFATEMENDVSTIMKGTEADKAAGKMIVQPKMLLFTDLYFDVQILRIISAPMVFCTIKSRCSWTMSA